MPHLPDHPLIETNSAAICCAAVTNPVNELATLAAL